VEEKREEYIATGRRKRAVASVWLRPSDKEGTCIVNRRPIQEYFPSELQRKVALAPLALLDRLGRYDVLVRLVGGGVQGQVEAMRLGIARALEKEDGERRQSLKRSGYLKRDPRKKERKKYGLSGARARFQHSKR